MYFSLYKVKHDIFVNPKFIISFQVFNGKFMFILMSNFMSIYYVQSWYVYIIYIQEMRKTCQNYDHQGQKYEIENFRRTKTFVLFFRDQNQNILY